MKSILSFSLFFVLCSHSQAAPNFSGCSSSTKKSLSTAIKFSQAYVEDIVKSHPRASRSFSASQIKKIKRSFSRASYTCKDRTSSLSCKLGAIAYVIPFGSTVYICEENVGRYGYDDICSTVGVVSHETSHVAGVAILNLKHNSLTPEEKKKDLAYILEDAAESFCEKNF